MPCGEIRELKGHNKNAPGTVVTSAGGKLQKEHSYARTLFHSGPACQERVLHPETRGGPHARPSHAQGDFRTAAHAVAPTHRSSGGTAMMKLSIFLLWLALGLYEQARQWKRLGRMAREYEKEVRP